VRVGGDVVLTFTASDGQLQCNDKIDVTIHCH
jgi:hypothetical protein